MKDRRKAVIRGLLFIVGLFISGLGVAITKRGELGVSPISSVANVMFMRFPILTLGNWLIVWNCVLILGQVLILGKQFKIYQLLQIPLSFLFGYFTDFGTFLMRFVNVNNYPMQLACVVCGTFVLGFGIAMTVTANVIMNSGEAIVKAMAVRTGKQFGNLKIGFDIFCVLSSVVLSLILFGGKIVGAREGTAFAAVFTGMVVKLFQKHFAKLLK